MSGRVATARYINDSISSLYGNESTLSVLQFKFFTSLLPNTIGVDAGLHSALSSRSSFYISLLT